MRGTGAARLHARSRGLTPVRWGSSITCCSVWPTRITPLLRPGATGLPFRDQVTPAESTTTTVPALVTCRVQGAAPRPAL